MCFPLREWRLLTAPWTGRNVSLDATARPATSPHLRRVGREVRSLNQLCRRRIGTTFALYTETGSESPVVHCLCPCSISLDYDTHAQSGSLYWYNRCHSGVQEGDESLRGTCNLFRSNSSSKVIERYSILFATVLHCNSCDC